MELTQEIKNDVRCGQCQGLLSSFPVYTYENGTFVCGKCPLVVDDNPSRDSAYEALAKHIRFPCKYESNNCMEYLLPEELHKHEASCNHRLFFCPKVGGCQWQGGLEELLEHYHTSHASLFFDGQEKCKGSIHMDDAVEENYILDDDDRVFIIQIKFIHPYLYCAVKFLGADEDAKLYRYNICMYNGFSTDGNEFSKNPVISNDNNSTINTEEAFSFDVTEFNVTGEFHWQVFVTEKKPVKPKYVPPPQSVENKVIISELECRICMEIIFPPIFQCSNGHIICETCKNNCATCPTCKVVMSNIRNLPLENIANEITYPCPNAGCCYMFKVKDKAAHDAVCEFTPYKCPLDPCKTGVSYDKFYKHVLDKHSEQIVDFNHVNAYENQTKIETMLVFRNKRAFLLRHKFVNGIFHVGMALYGPRGEQAGFMYAIKMGPNDPASPRLYVKLAMPRFEDVGDNLNYFRIPTDCLNNFKKELQLTYSFDIFENK